jgi:hypothetical protein
MFLRKRRRLKKRKIITYLKKEKKSIYHYLSGEGKKRWSVLSHLKDVQQERKLNWAKVWCNKTHTTCVLIGPEDELDSDDFERVQQLI